MCENFECSNGPCLSIARCKFLKVKHFVYASDSLSEWQYPSVYVREIRKGMGVPSFKRLFCHLMVPGRDCGYRELRII
jgi:hypothetical protein